MKNKNLNVVYWKDGRYVIADENSGEIVDDAQGYGYKDIVKATKAMWWKFNGGKEKKSAENNLFKKWLKDDGNKNIFDDINKAIEWNFKELARNEITINDIIKEIERNYQTIIPEYVINNL